MNIPLFLRTGVDIVNSLLITGIAIELQFYHFPDSDRLRWSVMTQIV